MGTGKAMGGIGILKFVLSSMTYGIPPHKDRSVEATVPMTERRNHLPQALLGGSDFSFIFL